MEVALAVLRQATDFCQWYTRSRTAPKAFLLKAPTASFLGPYQYHFEVCIYIYVNICIYTYIYEIYDTQLYSEYGNIIFVIIKALTATSATASKASMAQILWDGLQEGCPFLLLQKRPPTARKQLSTSHVLVTLSMSVISRHAPLKTIQELVS